MFRIFSTIILLLSIIAYSGCSTPQTEQEAILDHITVLASDSLEGREVGEIGEWKAATYISNYLKNINLQPKGDSGSFLQAFDFIKSIDPGPKSQLIVNNQELAVETEWQPLPHSSDMQFRFNEVVDVGYGIISNDAAHNDYLNKDVSGKAVLVRRYSPESDSSSDTTLEKYSSLISKINSAKEQGAEAVVFITPSEYDDAMPAMGVSKVTSKEIPVIFLKRDGLEKLKLDLTNPSIESIAGTTELIRVRDTGYNVVGYLPGQTDTTVIIGAHYDHLGWGGPLSNYKGDEKKIHYGADDNASGVAAIMELARSFSESSEKLKYSLLFIAFSGEEAGMLGSSHYVRNWTIDNSKIRMMLNFDMIGRLAEQEKGLIILGTGSCKEFAEYFENFVPDDLTIAFKKSFPGASDHIAFYNNSIPALHFFTGAHKDYHTPDDVIDKIDTKGIVTVNSFIRELIFHFNTLNSEFVFQRTKSDGKGRHRRSHNVSLGVIPDFISEVQGFQIDGVTPEEPADKAGLQKGDIIIKMGNTVVNDIYDYMNGLAHYKKDDTTEVMYIRETDSLKTTIVF